nr:tyrosine-type recombinase/integrase [Candidatus Sigynarchaeota archaeon]
MSIILDAAVLKIHESAIDFVPEADRAQFEKYILKRWKHSPNTAKSVSSCVKHFYDFVEHAIAELTFDDIDEYIEHLDTCEFKRSSKMAYITSIHKYVQTVTYELNRRGARIVELFPPEIEFMLDDVENIEGDEGLIPDEIMDKILATARARSQREYVFFLLLKMCGMRVSECRSIKKKNIHLEDRYLVTGVVHGCRKSNKNGDKPSVYFFTQAVANQIRQYFTLLKLNEEWLFPGFHGNEFMAYPKYLFIDYSKIVGFDFNAHAFRRTIITKRFKMDCPINVSHLLANHAIEDIEFQHYIKLSIAERRALYDLWNPYK